MSTTQPLQGLITSSYGRHYQLELGDGSRLLAHPRGKKNEVVVGDRVIFQKSQDEAVIEKIIPRHNLFYRQDEMRTKAFAANIDQILLMIAAEPEFSSHQVNRTLIAANAQHIPVIIALNKSDLKEPYAHALKRMHPYIKMGCNVIQASILHLEGIHTLTHILQQKVSLVLGPSGSGKSTLINTLVPDAKAQTQEISKALKTGKHTTTSSQWYWLSDHASALIDSPGFQEFGLHHIDPTQIASLMPDLTPFIPACKFYNCSHLHEPGCGVIAAVDRKEIDTSRYCFYQEVMQELLATRKY